MKYEYGEAYKDYPVDDFTFTDGSRLKVHNIFDQTPDFMKESDLLFVDPPWNQGNLRLFYTKNGEILEETYEDFYTRLFEVIKEIKPKIAYIEVGKEHLADFIIEMRKLFKYVTFYNSTYYRSAKNLCYVIRGSQKSKKPKLDGMDEEEIIEWVCTNEDYQQICDPCMGQGLVAYYASKAGKRFAGTEMNPKRLAVARKRAEEGKR